RSERHSAVSAGESTPSRRLSPSLRPHGAGRDADATAGWEATRRLRAWEKPHLSLRSGQRFLDVGGGLGDAALGVAVDLGTETPSTPCGPNGRSSGSQIPELRSR